jgi:hypothetical protein
LKGSPYYEIFNDNAAKKECIGKLKAQNSNKYILYDSGSNPAKADRSGQQAPIRKEFGMFLFWYQDKVHDGVKYRDFRNLNCVFPVLNKAIRDEDKKVEYMNSDL